MQDNLVTEVAKNISNYLYSDNLHATKELMQLLDRVSRNPLNTCQDYVEKYDDNFYTFQTWDELVEDERRQIEGLTEDECKEQLGKTIWKLSCGWYVQYV